MTSREEALDGGKAGLALEADVRLEMPLACFGARFFLVTPVVGVLGSSIEPLPFLLVVEREDPVLGTAVFARNFANVRGMGHARGVRGSDVTEKKSKGRRWHFFTSTRKKK